MCRQKKKKKKIVSDDVLAEGAPIRDLYTLVLLRNDIGLFVRDCRPWMLPGATACMVHCTVPIKQNGNGDEERLRM